jgi:hypothetical protein
MVYCCPRCDNSLFFIVGEVPGLEKMAGFCCSICDLTFYFPTPISRISITTKRGDDMALDEYPSKPMSDKEWRAREDARTLAIANVIAEDPQRLSAAKDAARKMAEEEQKEASAMKKVANNKSGKSRDTSSNVTDFNVFKNVTKRK